MKTVRALVSGKVQGVGYRYFVKSHADSLGVEGHAKNLANGQVEVLMQGADGAVRSLVDQLEKGPRFAEVMAVSCADGESIEEFSGFGTS